MIITDASREVPHTWTDDLCAEFFDHARELGLNGNPGGYMVTVELFPFVGIEQGEDRLLKPESEWNYDGIRQWIAENPKDVTRAWQRVVRRPY